VSGTPHLYGNGHRAPRSVDKERLWRALERVSELSNDSAVGRIRAGSVRPLTLLECIRRIAEGALYEGTGAP